MARNEARFCWRVYVALMRLSPIVVHLALPQLQAYNFNS
jgi:hypothetical protein